MKKTLRIACLYTVFTALLLGLVYPLAVAAVARLLFPQKAAGSLVVRNGEVIGSSLIGQSFAGPRYFHGRPSAAGNGYDAANSSGSNLGPTSAALVKRVDASVKQEGGNGPVPVDLVTASGSGLDPDISPAAAFYQETRVAAARGMSRDAVHALVLRKVQGRQLGLLGEPRVNVLALNLALDGAAGK